MGSIGVISASFGLDKFIERFGIERRVHTSGKDKGALDPFQPERPDDVARLKDLQRDVHDVFTGIVKERRAGKLKGPEEELFSGAFWSAAKAQEYGLIDGIADLRTKMQALHGDEGAAEGRTLGAGRAVVAFSPPSGFSTGFDDGFAFTALVGR